MLMNSLLLMLFNAANVLTATRVKSEILLKVLLCTDRTSLIEVTWITK